MSVEVPLDGEINVDYAQFYVLSDPEEGPAESDAGLVGQVNGLCDAGVTGSMCLVTGLNTGPVGLRVELHRREPPW